MRAVLGALAVALACAGLAAAQVDSPAVCAGVKREFEALPAAADAATLRALDRRIPAAACPQLKARMAARLRAVAPAPPAPAPAPVAPADPCIQARADWREVERSTNVAVLRAYRAAVPAACAVQRSLADARIAELSARPVEAARPAARPAVSPPPPASRAPTFRDCPECPEMVWIPGGTFTMGSPAGEAGRDSDEGPQRTVSVRAFAAGRFEVTRGEWSAFATATNRPVPSDSPWNNPGFAQDDRHPVVRVSRQDAQAYALWLSNRTGKGYRLLTEAEWEYAARAGTTTAYPWGASISPRNANYGDSGNGGTVRVGSYAANAFGLHDMAGNVWEWVEDCYASSYSGLATDGSANVNGDCSYRVNRGGSLHSSPQFLRSAQRGRDTPTGRYFNLGFRVARTP